MTTKNSPLRTHRDLRVIVVIVCQRRDPIYGTGSSECHQARRSLLLADRVGPQRDFLGRHRAVRLEAGVDVTEHPDVVEVLLA